jgi:hypothetical protein
VRATVPSSGQIADLVSLLNPQPLPRTSLEPVCAALAGVTRQQRTARGLSLNRLAELTRLARLCCVRLQKERGLQSASAFEVVAR